MFHNIEFPGPFGSGGCVVAPQQPRGFGFVRACRLVVSSLCLVFLAWLYTLGYEIEVLTALFAAGLAAGAAELEDLSLRLTTLLRRRFEERGGKR